MKNVLVVTNFNAGRKKAIIYKKTVLDFLIKYCCMYQFITIDQLNEINTDNFDTFLVMGGDGTVNKVAQYVINTDKVLGIIPLGTANLLANKLGITSNIKKSLEIIKQGKTTLIDVIQTSEKYSVLRIGFGYDADIICKTLQKFKNQFGYFSYFIAGIIFATKLKQKEYEITFNNETKKIQASCIICANSGNMFRNLFSISKKSKLDDGLIDIFILKVKNPITFFYEFLRIIFNIKKTTSRAIYNKTPSIKIKNYWCASHIDGEKNTFKNNIELKALKKALKVYCK